MFNGKFTDKIKTPADLAKTLGGPPRDTKVIMCHGTFDVVHPGHIRHLIYAKEKADILVVSLTGDEHIKKANMRPYVPEELRAINLAALEMVDHVVIDRNATPLENIAILKPDFFAKGYEYNAEGLHPRSQEELEVLESYGGEFIFTPGDVVYSSSNIIDSGPPNIRVEKLWTVMNGEGLTFDRLRDMVRDLRGVAVHVVGDTIVDSYVHTVLIGGSTKTPTFSVRYESQDDYVGGAGVVAKHLKAAGADVTFTTILGDDELAKFVIDDLENAGIVVNALLDPTRPTTNKKAFIAGGYRLLKVDTLDNRSIADGTVADVAGKISSTPGDVVLFSDFRHGIFNTNTIPKLVEAIPDGVIKVADSQVASRWGNILEFTGFDLITPNEREARFALGDQDSVIRPLALRLYTEAQCKMLILKLGARGSITYRPQTKGGGDPRSFVVLDSFADRVIDAVGSGDALLAYATLILARYDDPVAASIVGSFAAACECEYDGNIPIDVSAIMAKIDYTDKLADYSQVAAPLK